MGENEETEVMFLIKKEMTMKFWRIYGMFWFVPSRQTQIPPWYHDMVLATCRSK
jgi:hypothetical protein